jgi:hypothetical protein
MYLRSPHRSSIKLSPTPRAGQQLMISRDIFARTPFPRIANPAHANQSNCTSTAASTFTKSGWKPIHLLVQTPSNMSSTSSRFRLTWTVSLAPVERCMKTVYRKLELKRKMSKSLFGVARRQENARKTLQSGGFYPAGYQCRRVVHLSLSPNLPARKRGRPWVLVYVEGHYCWYMQGWSCRQITRRSFPAIWIVSGR